MKLALGTAQFGLKYGINNKHGVPSGSEVTSILNYAFEKGIRTIDCASSYGDAESKLGLQSTNSFQIITKFPAAKNKNELLAHIKGSLERLKLKSLYGYLAHQPNSLIEYANCWDELVGLKEKGLTQKIGFSVYTPQELEKLLQLNFIPDIVQIPYSLLDRKFENYFDDLKSLNVEIHTRSAFLQGLYFLDPLKLPPKLQPLKEPINSLKQFSMQNSISMSTLALAFVYYQKNIDKIVIGVDSLSQLKENIKSISSANNIDSISSSVKHIQITTPELLNPANW